MIFSAGISNQDNASCMHLDFFHIEMICLFSLPNSGNALRNSGSALPFSGFALPRRADGRPGERPRGRSHCGTGGSRPDRRGSDGADRGGRLDVAATFPGNASPEFGNAFPERPKGSGEDFSDFWKGVTQLRIRHTFPGSNGETPKWGDFTSPKEPVRDGDPERRFSGAFRNTCFDGDAHGASPRGRTEAARSETLRRRGPHSHGGVRTVPEGRPPSSTADVARRRAVAPDPPPRPVAGGVPPPRADVPAPLARRPDRDRSTSPDVDATRMERGRARPRPRERRTPGPATTCERPRPRPGAQC